MSHDHGGQLSLGTFGKAASPDHVRRDPEKSVLYQVVAQNLNSFLQATEIEGKRFPRHVVDEFEQFLRCGILAHGFLRLRCETCSHERVVAFSCKKRGICSSCGGRRMAETAANLVDQVIPKVGVRQWVVSFPFPVRFLLARDSKIQSACLKIVLRAISQFLKKRVKHQGTAGDKLETGAVTLIQRFGGSINLNVHLHMLILDGAYDVGGEPGKPPQFRSLQGLSDDDVKSLVKTIALRVVRYLKKQGHFRDDEATLASDDAGSDEVMPELQAASVRSRIAMGERRGQPVRRLGSLGRIVDENPETKAPLCAAIQGFSLHAGVCCAPWEREKLEKLARYVARPAVAEERLRVFALGEIGYKLKRSYSDGTSHLIFSPLELMEKLAALIPQPRVHLVRYHGCLAPHAKIRSAIVPKKPEPQAQVTPDVGVSATAADGAVKPTAARRHRSWAELLARVFAIDMDCPNCHIPLKPVAAILDTQVITKILDHLGLPSQPPVIAPARLTAALDYCKA